MSFNCKIENKLHQARILLLNAHHQEAIQLYFSYCFSSYLDLLNVLII